MLSLNPLPELKVALGQYIGRLPMEKCSDLVTEHFYTPWTRNLHLTHRISLSKIIAKVSKYTKYGINVYNFYKSVVCFQYLNLCFHYFNSVQYNHYKSLQMQNYIRSNVGYVFFNILTLPPLYVDKQVEVVLKKLLSILWHQDYWPIPKSRQSVLKYKLNYMIQCQDTSHQSQTRWV